MVKYAKTQCARLVSKMNTKFTTKLFTTLLILLIVTPLINAGCQEEEGQLPPPPSSSELSSTLVPNTQLDVYIYAKQEKPTTIPVEMINAPGDIDVESLAVWGVPADDDFALAVSITLTSASDATKLYAEINLAEDGWKMLTDNTIYLVQGSGTAAESLKTAISNHDFKYYDDSEALEAVATLPSLGTTKLAAIALAKPSKALIGFIAKYAASKDLEHINMILELVNLKVIAVGLYSPQQINIAETVEIIRSDGGISNPNLGLLILIKSGLPGLLVEPAVKKFLTESEFTETNLDEFTLYKGSWDIDDGKAIPVLVRIEGNHIFAAVAGQESYAETLIKSVQVQ